MPNTREKLIELLSSDYCPLFLVFGDSMYSIVDYLIANGVTVQKWIPVTERLPEMRDDGFADAFFVTDGSLVHIAYFVDGDWIFTDNGQMKEPMFYDVTHWMPLPELPEGE